MRLIFAAAVLLAACAEKPAFEYPAEARAAFAKACPTGVKECDCTWEKITRAMPHEEYEAAMARLQTEGVMAPRLVRISVDCGS
jgi:hypothetical protein